MQNGGRPAPVLFHIGQDRTVEVFCSGTLQGGNRLEPDRGSETPENGDDRKVEFPLNSTGPLEITFLLQVVLSFLISGIWIAGSTRLAERLGSRIGGLVANLPSKLLISLVFVSLVQDPSFAMAAARAVPIGMLINSVFLFLFIVTAPRGLRVALPVSLGAWLVLARLAEGLQIAHFGLGVVLYLVVTLAAWSGLEFRAGIPELPGRTLRRSAAMLIARGVFAGGVVAATVLLARFISSYWTGLLATFPAVMLTTMVILTFSGGPGLARATGKVMLFASTNILVFAGAVILFYPRLGMPLGTLLAFLAAVGWVALLNPVLDRWTGRVSTV